MKKTFLMLLPAILVLSVAVHAQSLPYQARYSSSFKTGNNDHSRIVLDLYKAYEANDTTKDFTIADTVVAQLPDGQIISGKSEVLNTFTNERKNIGEMKVLIDAVVPLNSTDKKENWVAVWGSFETSMGTSDFHSIWKFNKDNKVDFLRIYNSAAARK